MKAFVTHYKIAGYAGTGTGELARHERQEFVGRIEKLLAARAASAY